MTFAGSSGSAHVLEKHRVDCVGVAPGGPAVGGQSRAALDGTAGPSPTPVYDAPLPSVTVLVAPRSWVLAATVVSQGAL